MLIFSRIIALSKSHPIIRGMVSYSIIWPTSNIIQQTITGKRWDTYDWSKVLHFGVWGSLYVAPTLYTWVKLASIMWPKSNLRSAVTKAIVEQITYTPFAISSFFVGMSLLDGKSPVEAMNELKMKFFPTYEVAVCIWPFLQTFNFYFVPERNRVFFVSICSLMWTSFLAYMKYLETKKLGEKQGGFIPMLGSSSV